jgi:hypothetical protein
VSGGGDVTVILPVSARGDVSEVSEGSDVGDVDEVDALDAGEPGCDRTWR